MNKTASIILILGLVLVLIVIFTYKPNNSDSLSNGQNIELKDGVQYIRINAKGGYTPNKTSATAGIPTKLIVETEGTFDCSSALVIREVNFAQMLPQTGETIIDLGTPEAGTKIEGLCSMGMYNFDLSFN